MKFHHCILATCIAVSAAQSDAADISLNFTGTTSTVYEFQQPAGEFDSEGFYLTLDSFAEVSLNSADTVTANIHLDSPLTIPASSNFLSFGLRFLPRTIQAGESRTTDTAVALYLDGAPVFELPSEGNNSSSEVSDNRLWPSRYYQNDGAPALVFDEVRFQFSIANLATPTQYATAILDAQWVPVSTVPEPSQALFFAFGTPFLFGILRRRIGRR